jgi:hypothetical protein
MPNKPINLPPGFQLVDDGPKLPPGFELVSEPKLPDGFELVQTENEQSSPVARFLGGAWQNLNPLTAVKGLATAVAHPIDTGAAILSAQGEQFKKAADDYSKGRYSEMVGHGAAGLLPLLGPAAAAAGERIGEGDVAGGLGEGTGLVGSMFLGPKAGKGAAKATRAAQGAATEAAERVVSSSLKVPKTLTKANRTINIPRVVLDEGLASNRFGLGNLKTGAAKAAQLVEDLSNEVSNRVAATGGRKFDLQPVLDHLDRLEAEYLHQPAAEADLAAVRNARRQLLENPLYSKDKFATQITQQPTGILDAQGNPTFRSVPQQVKVGRELVPQTATEIDAMKKNVYGGLKGKYGVEKGAVIESDKAMGRGLKEILDQNVPGVEAINRRQSGVIAARNALQDAAMREANKLPVGLMDLLGLEGMAHLLTVTHNPVTALVLGIPLALKHPSTAIPIARGLDALGKARRLAPAAKVGAGAAMRVGNPLNKTTVDSLYDEYLASSGK